MSARTRTLGWRPDRYRTPNCTECGVLPATVGNLCVQCHYTHWQAEQAEQAAQASIEAPAPSFVALNGRQPVAGQDYDAGAAMCQDDYEYLSGTGRYSDAVAA